MQSVGTKYPFHDTAEIMGRWEDVMKRFQVDHQPGMQERHLISFISQYELWISREVVPLYTLHRDQKKGSDLLETEGFYDATHAYGLPSTIIDLDRGSQEQVPYRFKTAFGFTDPFIVDGVTKQGGSLSPLKFTLTTSLGNGWIADRKQDFPGSIVLKSHLPAVETHINPSMNSS